MIAPEPVEQTHSELYSYPSDQGLQSKVLTALITVSDGVGAAGHLSILEDRCPAIHGEQGTDRPDMPWPDGLLIQPMTGDCSTCRAAA